MTSENKTYIRDGRAPVPVNEATSRYMSANKAKNTKPELVLRQALTQSGYKGYRLHWKKAPGTPDIAFPGKRIAIFVNGCFWHRCPKCGHKLPKSNTDFWAEKFRKNQERDQRKQEALRNEGWQVVVVWECEIKKELEQVVGRISEVIGQYRP